MYRSRPRAGRGWLICLSPVRVFGFVINLLILIAGLAALASVDVCELPDVDQPVLSERSGYEGAVPDTVDQRGYAGAGGCAERA